MIRRRSTGGRPRLAAKLQVRCQPFLQQIFLAPANSPVNRTPIQKNGLFRLTLRNLPALFLFSYGMAVILNPEPPSCLYSILFSWFQEQAGHNFIRAQTVFQPVEVRK